MSDFDVGASGPGRTSDLMADLRSGRIEGPEARLRAATTLLESSFYEELFKAMRDTVPEGGALPAGQGQDMFESMLDQRVAESAAASSDRGLGRALYRYLAGVASIPVSDPAGADPSVVDPSGND